MKDVLIGFILALVLGSLWNGIQPPTEEAQQNAQTQGVNDANSMPLTIVNDSNFQGEVIDQEQPVLVDFYTQNCPHCRKMAPILSQIAKEYTGSLKVVQVEIMDSPVIAHKYDIAGVPAFLLFDKGKPVESCVGETSKTNLLSVVKPHLTSTSKSQGNSAGTT